jgi:hypothetical protein
LHEQLLEVVQETMQPTHVSLWMRKPSYNPLSLNTTLSGTISC